MRGASRRGEGREEVAGGVGYLSERRTWIPYLPIHLSLLHLHLSPRIAVTEVVHGREQQSDAKQNGRRGR